MEELSTSEVVLASMTPEEAREFNQGNKENTLIYRAAKAKAKRLLAEKAKTKTVKKSNKRPETTMERIARIQYEYMPKKTERPKHMDNKNIYSFEDQEIWKNNINKKVAKIPVLPPKPDLVNGHSDWSTDDWLETIDQGGWVDDRKAEANGLYEKYLELLKAGELLPGTSFEMFEKNYYDFDTDLISKIKKRVKDKKKTEGLAAILGVSPDRI